MSWAYETNSHKLLGLQQHLHVLDPILSIMLEFDRTLSLESRKYYLCLRDIQCPPPPVNLNVHINQSHQIHQNNGSLRDGFSDYVRSAS